MGAAVTRLRVGLLGAGPSVQAAHLPALVSLPERYAVSGVSDPDPARAAAVAERLGVPAMEPHEIAFRSDVVCVTGPPPDRTEALRSIGDGVRGIMVDDPPAQDAGQARDLAGRAEERELRVGVCSAPAHDPALAGGIELAGDLVRDASLATLTFVVGPPWGLVDAQTQPVGIRPEELWTPSDPGAGVRERLRGPGAGIAAVLRLVFGGVDDVTHAATFDGGVEAVLHCGEVSVHVTLVAQAAPRALRRLELVAPDAYVDISLAEPMLTGDTGGAMRMDADGVRHAIVPHEGPVRRAWRDLHEAVTGGRAPTSGLREAAADLEILERIAADAG